MKVLLILLGAVVLIAACTPNVSPDSYSVGSVGQVNRVVRGVIISVRLVQITGTTSGVGATAGVAGGAVAGSTLGGGDRAAVLGAIGGALIGGIAGAAIEEGATRQMGVEYVVEAENGALLTLVQGDEQPLSVGQKVLVIYGSRSRVIADQRSSKD